MDKSDRIFKLHGILRVRRRPIAREALRERVECSVPTLYRLLRVLRDQLHAPLEYDTERAGYFYRRDASGECFDTLASATLQRRKLHIDFHSRGKDEHTERTVSPQRLTHYRDVWYQKASSLGRRGLSCSRKEFNLVHFIVHT